MIIRYSVHWVSIVETSRSCLNPFLLCVFYSHVHDHVQLSLRNSAATLEAERRMLAISIASMKTEAATTAASSAKGRDAVGSLKGQGQGQEEGDRRATAKYLSDLQLQPEVS
jgi:hypothetical protein